MSQPASRNRPATIVDVAREAGVAVGTVSRYINGLPIRGGNRERIAQVETLLKREAEKIPAVIAEEEALAYYAANPQVFESAGRPLPFEQVRERITAQLVTFKRSEALNALLTRLRSAARIETFI